MTDRRKNNSLSLFRFRPLRYLLLKLRFPRDPENVQTAIHSIKSAANLTGPSLWVLVAAIFIASLGLNTNSTAVIIGAMLISPLMGPITGFGLGLATDDIFLVKKSIRNFVVMVFMSVATSTIFFLLSPVKEAGSELLGRTSPTIYDVLIAFFGGVAGIIASASRLRNGTVIPGVAIATALMPPLCTMGYGISILSWKYIFGAFYLFMINSVFISLATYFVVNILKYPRAEVKEPVRRKRIHSLITVIVLLMIAPSIYLTFHIVKKYFYQQRVESFVKNVLQDESHIVVTSKFVYNPGRSKLEVVMVGDAYDSLQKEDLRDRMASYGLSNCELILYQGPDSRAAAKNIFETLNSDVEVQRMSIKEMYIRMDSLQRGMNGAVLPDSLQIKLAKEVYASDSSLLRLTVQRSLSFNPALNRDDTLWQVQAAFKNELLPLRRAQLEAWLKGRLQSFNVRLRLEEP